MVFGSVWTYVILMSFFALLLVLMLVHFLRNRNLKKPAVNTDSVNECSESRTCEEKLLHTIETLSRAPKTVLLAAAGLEYMPVTVPIRIAMEVSAKKQRCLLIDLDTRRNAVWKAFGLEAHHSSTAASPIPSGIRNLSVLPALYFEQNKVMNIGSITRSAEKQYDLILINAPYLDGHPDRKMITSSAQYAFVFAKEPSQIDRLQQLCNSGHCKVLGCYKMQKNGSGISSVQ